MDEKVLPASGIMVFDNENQPEKGGNCSDFKVPV